LKLVLDTNVWLDVLVFRDPSVAFLRKGAFEFYTDARCEEEFVRVLGYEFASRLLDSAARERAIAEFGSWNLFLKIENAVALPRCEDADDQKFLEVAAAAGARFLITKDAALLALDRRNLAFRIVRPGQFPTG
jgi:putative PIN family toxin of toxin-antitoxin system